MTAAVVSGAFAISTYQSFLFALAAMGFGLVLLRDFEKVAPARFFDVARIALVVVASTIVYFAIAFLFRLFIPGHSAYFVDIARQRAPKRSAFRYGPACVDGKTRKEHDDEPQGCECRVV